MTEGIIIAIITGGMAIISNIVVAWAQNSKTVYRIVQLEKKVEAHNKLQDRVLTQEINLKAAWRNIDEIKDTLKEMEAKQ